jgi:hypothetical protein
MSKMLFLTLESALDLTQNISPRESFQCFVDVEDKEIKRFCNFWNFCDAGSAGSEGVLGKFRNDAYEGVARKPAEFEDIDVRCLGDCGELT